MRLETAKPDSIGEWSELGDIRMCEKIVPFGDVGDKIWIGETRLIPFRSRELDFQINYNYRDMFFSYRDISSLLSKIEE